MTILDDKVVILLASQIHLGIAQEVVESSNVVHHIVNVDQNKEDQRYYPYWVTGIEVYELEGDGKGEVEDGNLVEIGEG